MEPDRLAYSAIGDRPKITWPGGARVAVWVLPNIEHYEYLPVHSNQRDPWPRSPHPDILGYGDKDYGNRVGVWRMFELMDKHEIRCTVSLNFSVIEHYPEIFEAMEARKYDYLCHGIYNTRYLWGLPEDEERQVIQDCVETLKRATGRQLAGWFGPAASFTLNTPDLVVEAGIKYCSDWYHDDQPCPIKVRRGKLITVPYSMDINDAIEYRYATEGEEFARLYDLAGGELDPAKRQEYTDAAIQMVADTWITIPILEGVGLFVTDPARVGFWEPIYGRAELGDVFHNIPRIEGNPWP